MRAPLDHGVGLALGLDAWLNGSHIPLAVAAHPSGALLALARGAVLSVIPLLPDNTAAQQQADHAATSYPIHRSQHQYTALEWFAQLKPSRSITPARITHSPTQHSPQRAAQHEQHLGVQVQQPRQTAAAESHKQEQSSQPQESHLQPPDQQRWQQPRCLQETAEALLELVVLLSGTADGHLQIHSADGQLLFKQRLAASPVLDILVRPHCSGLCSSDASEEVCITFTNAFVRINTLDLRSQLRMLQLAQSGGTSAVAKVAPLPHVRYELPTTVGPRVSGISLGLLPADMYSLLSSAAGSSSGTGSRAGKHKVCIVTVGSKPCLAACEAEETPSRSTLAAIVGMASSLTVGVVGAASKAARLGPSVMYHSAKSVTKSLYAWYSSSSGHETQSIAHPAVAYEDLQELPKPEPLTLARQLRDDDRVLEGLVAAPTGALLVAPDNLGRVLLVDGASMAAVRIWKGYRDAQCGWLLPPPFHPTAALGLLLVLFAPKRQVLEVWLPRSGQRLASTPVDYPCLLVTVGLPCGGWGNGLAWQAWQEQCGSATTLVMNVQTGDVYDALDCLMEE